MSEDVPLSAFGGDGSEAGDEDDPTAGNETDGQDEDDDGGTPAEPETPTLTYTSSPDGATCAACGETVEKRWRAGEGGVAGDDGATVEDPDALVCPDCKEW